MVGQNIAKALAAFNAANPLIPKSGVNSRLNYSYATLEDFLRIIPSVLKLFELSVLTTVEMVVDLPARGAKGEQNACRVQLRLTLVHSSGESVQVLAWGEGQDHGDKAVYKAITGARKYGLACLLNLATSDDPERDTRIDDEAPHPPPKPTAAVGNGNGKSNGSLGEKISSAIKFFAEHDISKEEVEAKIGKPAYFWTLETLVELGKYKQNPQSIKDKE